jgi:hypothetical protein
MKENTFGDYEFEAWVPEEIREQIRNFWGQMGRTHEDWFKNGTDDISDLCYHGPNPNGFRNPPMGARAIYLQKDYALTKQTGQEVFKKVEGRYIHAWNNMGRLVHDDGTRTVVSSCDMWVRVWQDEQEKECALS